MAGGVSANRNLRARLGEALGAAGVRVFYPAPQFCTDNGAMIAYAGAQRLAAGEVDPRRRPRCDRAGPWTNCPAGAPRRERSRVHRGPAPGDGHRGLRLGARGAPGLTLDVEMAWDTAGRRLRRRGRCAGLRRRSRAAARATRRAERSAGRDAGREPGAAPAREFRVAWLRLRLAKPGAVAAADERGRADRAR
jgi:hypothetical protein